MARLEKPDSFDLYVQALDRQFGSDDSTTVPITPAPRDDVDIFDTSYVDNILSSGTTSPTSPVPPTIGSGESDPLGLSVDVRPLDDSQVFSIDSSLGSPISDSHVFGSPSNSAALFRINSFMIWNDPDLEQQQNSSNDSQQVEEGIVVVADETDSPAVVTSDTNAEMNTLKKRSFFSRSSTNASSGNLGGTTTTASPSTSTNDIDFIDKSPDSSSHNIQGALTNQDSEGEDRFNGDGVQFPGCKLIGHEYVADARGDTMCQQSMKKIKIIQKAMGGHKRRVNLSVSFEGIKIFDSMTNELLFHHTVPQISFISRDEGDPRAFGYVFGNSTTGHQFIAIKTKKEAMVVMSTIGQLFAITLKRRRSADEAANRSGTAEPSTSANDDHMYHYVGEEGGDKSKSRSDLKRGGSMSSDKNPVVLLPPPDSSHRRHHNALHSNQVVVQLPEKSSKPSTSDSNYVNNFDLFAGGVDGGAQQQQAQTSQKQFEWANFDDSPVKNVSMFDDSTLNSISDLNSSRTVTGNDPSSATLVARFNQKNHPKNSSTSTIASGNFDGVDPFSDAFGNDDPFSGSQAVGGSNDLSNLVFSAKSEIPELTQQLNHVNLNQSSGSATLGDLDRLDNQLFQSTTSISSADRYAAFADVNNLSNSIFDRLAEKMNAEQAAAARAARQNELRKSSPQFRQASPNVNLFSSGSGFQPQIQTQTQTFQNIQQQIPQQGISTGFSPIPPASNVSPFQATSNSNMGIPSQMMYNSMGQMAPTMQPMIGNLMQQTQQHWANGSTSSLPNTFAQSGLMPVQTNVQTQASAQSLMSSAQSTPKRQEPSPFSDLDPLAGVRSSPNSFAPPKSESIGQHFNEEFEPSVSKTDMKKLQQHQDEEQLFGKLHEDYKQSTTSTLINSVAPSSHPPLAILSQWSVSTGSGSIPYSPPISSMNATSKAKLEDTALSTGDNQTQQQNDVVDKIPAIPAPLPLVFNRRKSSTTSSFSSNSNISVDGNKFEANFEQAFELIKDEDDSVKIDQTKQIPSHSEQNLEETQVDEKTAPSATELVFGEIEDPKLEAPDPIKETDADPSSSDSPTDASVSLPPMQPPPKPVENVVVSRKSSCASIHDRASATPPAIPPRTDLQALGGGSSLCGSVPPPPPAKTYQQQAQVSQPSSTQQASPQAQSQPYQNCYGSGSFYGSYEGIYDTPRSRPTSGYRGFPPQWAPGYDYPAPYGPYYSNYPPPPSSHGPYPPPMPPPPHMMPPPHMYPPDPYGYHRQSPYGPYGASQEPIYGTAWPQDHYQMFNRWDPSMGYPKLPSVNSSSSSPIHGESHRQEIASGGVSEVAPSLPHPSRRISSTSLTDRNPYFTGIAGRASSASTASSAVPEQSSPRTPPTYQQATHSPNAFEFGESEYAVPSDVPVAAGVAAFNANMEQMMVKYNGQIPPPTNAFATAPRRKPEVIGPNNITHGYISSASSGSSSGYSSGTKLGLGQALPKQPSPYGSYPYPAYPMYPLHIKTAMQPHHTPASSGYPSPQMYSNMQQNIPPQQSGPLPPPEHHLQPHSQMNHSWEDTNRTGSNVCSFDDNFGDSLKEEVKSTSDQPVVASKLPQKQADIFSEKADPFDDDFFKS